MLDFNHEEMTRTKLPMTKGGGKSGLWHQNQTSDSTAEKSLSALFVQFLQNESSLDANQATLGASLNKNSQQTKQLAKNLYQATNSSGNTGGNSSTLTVVNPFVSQSLESSSGSILTSSSSPASNSSMSENASASTTTTATATAQAQIPTATGAGGGGGGIGNSLLTSLHPHPVTLVTQKKNLLLDDCLNDSPSN